MTQASIWTLYTSGLDQLYSLGEPGFIHPNVEKSFRENMLRLIGTTAVQSITVLNPSKSLREA